MKQSLRQQKVNFTQIANIVLCDENLSAKAKGLYAYMYSKPDDWDFHTDRIAKEMKDGRDAVTTGLQELESEGYLMRKRKKNGRMEYLIRYDKDYDPDDAKSKKVEPSKASSGISTYGEDKPHEEIPKVGNPQSGKIRKVSNTDSKVTLSKSNKTAETSSADMQLDEFLQWCRGSEQRHINLIAEYADEKQLDFQTKEQWKQFLKRNVRAAKRLSPFTDDQISEAMKKLDADKAENDGFITRWTLETVEKYLHN